MSPCIATIPVMLASVSPRRRELLARMGVSFEAVASEVDEAMHPGELPSELAQRLSLAKAEVVASLHRDVVVVAADTLVALDGDVLAKPADEAAAFAMLARLRGREHLVCSGLSVIDVPRERYCTQVVQTSVLMRHYTDEQIREYVATGDPLDKAGAYAIQNAEFSPVARVKGCYANVMGLPMCHLYRVLRTWGVCPPLHPLDCCPLAVEEGCPGASGIIERPTQERLFRAHMGDG